MTEQSLPKLTKAPVPPQTHIKRLDERTAIGKALRERAQRQAQSEWKPPADRPDPVEMLIESSKGRVEELLPIRQLSDAKIKPVIEIMKEANLKGYAQLCGRALARAHARSGDAAVLAGYMGKSTAFEDALANFSVVYADQNERDHAALVQAVRNGRNEAQTE